MKNILIIVLFWIALATAQKACLSNQNVCYQGSWKETPLGTQYASFQGIRYAEPPIGNLRFKSPLPYEIPEGTIDVTSDSTIICPQLSGLIIEHLEGQEDCLFLNIYAPKTALENQEKLPVMLWIHGGSLTAGSGKFDSYGPQSFMDEDLVIVTINYRLGPLGFLTLGTAEVPGNAGLRDQVLAMQWVSDYIQNFGGDPQSITIFGESAGSLSVALHLLSPVTENLFQRAIMQSHSSLDPWGPLVPKYAVQYGQNYSTALGCADLNCLQSRDLQGLFDHFDVGRWMAVPDQEFSDEPYLPADPQILLESGQFNRDIEIIIGTNKDEGMLSLFTLILFPFMWENYRNTFDTDGVLGLLGIPDASEINSEDIEKTHKIAEFYVDSLDNLDKDHLYPIMDMYTDAKYLFGTFQMIDYFVSYGVKSFQYILTHQGEHSFSEYYGIPPIGVCHADDIQYLWGVRNLPEKDEKVKTIMGTAWANFAKYGDPSPPGTPFSWLPVDTSGFDVPTRYFNISGGDPSMDFSPEIKERMQLWFETILV